MADNILEIRHLSKSFGTHEVLRDIDFTVSKGDVISIIGASGSGKSTLLRCINLLETPSSGEILYHGENVTGKSVNAAKYRSHVGMVFQSFNLFNNMTVLKNCMVGQMKVLGRSKDDDAADGSRSQGKAERAEHAPQVHRVVFVPQDGDILHELGKLIHGRELLSRIQDGNTRSQCLPFQGRWLGGAETERSLQICDNLSVSLRLTAPLEGEPFPLRRG